MSKGSKRHSAKYNERLFRHLFAPQLDEKPTIAEDHPWLEMTDEQIDREYYRMGKADRTRLKKEAALARARKNVQAVLDLER